jgi:hypothetical protein
MTDRRGMKARRDRKLKRDAEVKRINSIYTLEVLTDNEDKSKAED